MLVASGAIDQSDWDRIKLVRFAEAAARTIEAVTS